MALARAIVFKPRLLLMDEPLGALDKQLRENLQLEMRRLHADLGITFIYVTHDQEEALDHVGPHRRHERRPGGAGRPARGSLRPAEQPLRRRASSASPISCRPIVRGMEDDVVVAECEGALIRADLSRPARRAATR